MVTARLDLTDAEWMSIIDKERDGLPPCCGNISALRDSIISHARNSGEPIFYSDFSELRKYLNWCFPDHDVPSDVIHKIMEQVSFEPSTEHERDDEVVLP